MATSTQVPTVALRGGSEIPQLGFGVFQIPPEDTVEHTLTALQTGYRHIDTARIYDNEAQVGQAIKASGIDRGDIFVTTKLWNDHQGYQSTHHTFKESLELLELDYVDLYLIHWPTPERDLYMETWKAFIELRDEGLIRAIGVSNFQADHLRRLIDESGEVPAVNQIELHPYLQQAGLRREHHDHGIVTEAWSPLAQGQVLDDPLITSMAKDHGISPGQIVLRWQLQLGNVVFPKSVTPDRIRQNFDVFGFHLSEAEMDAIAELDRGGRIGPDPDEFN